jgi:hypothetical protein
MTYRLWPSTLFVVVCGIWPARAAADTFTPTGRMTFARTGHQATLLLDGRALVSGGSDKTGNAIAQAEIYDSSEGPSFDTSRPASP